MQTVDVFKSLGEHMIDDGRVRHYGMVFARSGLKGLRRLNPTMVWLDAGLAVCDACNSYLAYASQRQINTRLALENSLLRIELELALKQLGLDYRSAMAEQANRLDWLTQQMMQSNLQQQTLIAQIRAHKDQVFRMHKLVMNERMHGYSPELEQLQFGLDRQIHATLLCLISATN